jgi:cyclopropane fatty-acyl-phospholipid synthase-like methyltransferase
MQTNPNKALWEKGDFTRIAASMRESGKALVATLGITSGTKVLDRGCGDGTTAPADGSPRRRRPGRRHRE